MDKQVKNGKGGLAGQPAARQDLKKKPRATQFFRPKSFGMPETAMKACPHCHQAVPAVAVICPHCGRSLTPDKCSFCGAPMKPSAKFCTHCGQSREGVLCPECGTLNARNFCRRCNAPLTPLARQAQEAAKNDPAFKAVQAKADELARLHARIEQLRQEASRKEDIPPQLSEDDRALLDEYAGLLQSIGASAPVTQAPVSQEEPRACPRYADTAFSLDELMTAYREKAAEMDAALEALVPPPDFTPEQQRDYYSARKVATIHTEYDMSGYQSTVWQCNYCGAYHENPSACVAPELGGNWVYITPEQYVEQSYSYIEASHTLRIE